MRQIAACGLLAMILLSHSAFAQPEHRCLLTALNGINLRSGPGTEFEILGSRIAEQRFVAEAQALDSEGQLWWRSQWKWLRADLVSEDGDCAGLPTAQPPEAPPYEIITPANAANLQELAFAPLPVPQTLAVNADGTRLALGTRAGEILLWDPISFENLGVVAEYAHKDELAFRPDVSFHPLDPHLLAVDLLDESRLFILTLPNQEVFLGRLHLASYLCDYPEM
jgi:hypothetical protein